MSYKAYHSPTPRLPVIHEELEHMRSSSISPVLSVPIMIPPIMIPNQPTEHVRPHAPYARPVIHTMIVDSEPIPTQTPIPPTELPSCIPACLCGYTKIVTGCIMCPIICSTSCLAGTCYTIYQFMCCNCSNNEALDYRDTFCNTYGCGTACSITIRLVESGLRDIRQPPTIQQDMVR